MYSNYEVQDMIEKLTGMLGHVRDTFIRGSELEAKVNDLEARINDVSASLEHRITQISELEQQLQYTRSERDGAVDQARQWQSKHDQVSNEHAELQQTYGNVVYELNSVREAARMTAEAQSVRITELTRDKDDAYNECTRLDVENSDLKRKLAEVEARFASIQELFMQKPSEPSSQPRDELGRFDYNETPKTGTGW